MSYDITNTKISGDLRTTNFAELICEIYYRKTTGCLHLESNIDLKIYFFHGFVEFVESDDPELLLGKLLVQNNYISEEEQQDILDFSRDKDIKLGQALIQTGKLTSHELNHILDLQIKLKLLNGFRFREGSYSFEYKDELHVDTLFHINPIQIIYDSIDSHIYVGDIDIRDNELEGTIYPTINYDELGKLTFSTSKEYKLVESIRKPVKLKEFVSNSPLGSQKTLNFIKFLKIAEFIKIEST